MDGAVARTAEWFAREARMLPACVLPSAGADAANCARSGGPVSVAPPGSRRAAQSGFGGKAALGGPSFGEPPGLARAERRVGWRAAVRRRRLTPPAVAEILAYTVPRLVRGNT